MPRYIDADEAFKVLSVYYKHKTGAQDSALHQALSLVRTVDAVPVIRCKDCKYVGTCRKQLIRNLTDGTVMYCTLGTDGFCSLAVREDDDQTAYGG